VTQGGVVGMIDSQLIWI